jgi:hypothetical protein
MEQRRNIEEPSWQMPPAPVNEARATKGKSKVEGEKVEEEGMVGDQTSRGNVKASSVLAIRSSFPSAA